MKRQEKLDITDEAFWDHWDHKKDGYLSDEYNRTFIEVEMRSIKFINDQNRLKQRSLTHADIIKICDDLGYELSHNQRNGMLQRLKTELIFMPAVKDVYREEEAIQHIRISDIRSFIEDDGWPVILPPLPPTKFSYYFTKELDERSYQLVEVLKKNGWDEEANTKEWAQRLDVFRKIRRIFFDHL